MPETAAGPATVLAPPATVRVAGGDDISMVVRLDAEAFPERSYNLQRAAPGELEAGVQAGDVRLLEIGGEPAGYIHVDRQAHRHELAGIGIRPQFQGGGYGTLLVDDFLTRSAGIRDTVPLIAVTSPRNRRMLTLLFARGFAGRWALPHYHGGGRHRIGCQLRVAGAPRALRDRRQASIDRVLDIMVKDRLIARVAPTKSTGTFTLSPEIPGEFLPCPRP